MHERQAIREAVVAQLVGVAPVFRTAARDRVTKSRMAPIRGELPAINVYTDGEEIDANSKNSAPRELMRTMTVTIEAWAKYAENVDDALDDLALEIETAMDLDLNLANTAFDSVLERTEIGIKLDGDRPMGCVHLEYAVTFHTDLRVAAPTDIFDTATVRYDLAGAQAPADERTDTLSNINQE